MDLRKKIDWTYPSPGDPPGKFYGAFTYHENGELRYRPQRPPATPAKTIIRLELLTPLQPGHSDLWDEVFLEISEEVGWSKTVWGQDLSSPESVTLFIQWKSTAPDHVLHSSTEVTFLAPIGPMLREKPQVYTLYLHWSLPGNPAPEQVVELMTLEGSGDILDHSIFQRTDVLTEIERGQPSGHGYVPPSDVPGIAQGWVLDRVPRSERVQIIMWSWRSHETQQRYKDPSRESDGENDDYEITIAQQLNRLENAGAKIDVINMRLQQAPSAPKSLNDTARKQHLKRPSCGCVIL